jgi:hypothetical protein
MSPLWIKLQADIVEHPKFIGLSPAAKWAFIEMMFYAQRNLSDGFIDGRVMRGKWADDVIEELLTNDKESPSLTRVGDDYQLHNYAKYQRSRAQVEELIETRQRNGSRGGQVSALSRSSKSEAKVKQTDSKSEANGVAKEYPDTDTDTDTEQVVVSKQTRKTELQLDWKPSPAGYEYAKQRAPGMNADIQAEKFVNYNLTQGRKLGDWEAAWRNWVLKAIEFDPLLAQPLPPPKKQFTGYEDDDDV